MKKIIPIISISIMVLSSFGCNKGPIPKGKFESLEISIEATDKPEEINELYKLSFNLKFANVGDENLRIFLVKSPALRTHSNITVYSKTNSRLISNFPNFSPHGYRVTEDDFHLIKPEEEITFTQTVYVEKEKYEKYDEFIVKWKYNNEVESWTGGIETLDGPTLELFDGETIPYIWLGEIETKTDFTKL